jgi:hypothetical protein
MRKTKGDPMTPKKAKRVEIASATRLITKSCIHIFTGVALLLPGVSLIAGLFEYYGLNRTPSIAPSLLGIALLLIILAVLIELLALAVLSPTSWTIPRAGSGRWNLY